MLSREKVPEGPSVFHGFGFTFGVQVLLFTRFGLRFGLVRSFGMMAVILIITADFWSWESDLPLSQE